MARLSSSALAIGFLVLGLAAGGGGTWFALRPKASAAEPKQLYQCPMHPQIIMDHEGDCPICGMKLVPIEASAAPPAAEANVPQPAAPVQAQGGKQLYQCPMHPQIIMDHEGDCPICGMKLVPMENAQTPAPSSVNGLAPVTIDAQRQQLIGLHTAKAVESDLGSELRTTGRVAVDETRVRKVNVKVEGFVEKLFVDFTGKFVAKAQPLFSLYSPEFVSAQQEYLLALQTQKQLTGGTMQASGNDLLEAARRRLQFWDVPASELEQLEKTGEVRRTLTLRSPIGGVVTTKNVVEGARVSPADALFEITDLGSIWVLADVYESELARVKVGTEAELTLGAYQGQIYRGRVAFIDPAVDPKTRTVKVRIQFANPKGELKPEMFGEVVFKARGRKGLVVPLDAVLDSGTRKVVFVALGDGRFEPREVQTGAGSGDNVEIMSGLKAGEEVVTRANFLVDSESRLKAALAQMAGGGNGQ
jgi:membrane fusion protein, copper/silver efflux system